MFDARPWLQLLHLFICASLSFIPAGALASEDHSRPPLSLAQEVAWLDLLVSASPHRLALEAANAAASPAPPSPPSVADPLAPAPPPAKAWPAKKGRRCYGFLPYWTASGATLHWDELTQLAWFAAEVSASGEFTNVHGWGGAAAKKLVGQAHSHGVQVPLTVTLFSKSGISAVLATAPKRTALIAKTIDLVISGGGDGVNIDFEGLALADRDNMKAFIAELNTTMKQKLPGADVTLATPAVDWGGAWDYDYLAEHSDGLFVMAYGIHYKGSNPGPQLPMAAADPWKHKTLAWLVDDYFKWGKAANKHKFIIGLPLYGNKWPSASGLPGASKLSNGAAVTMENAWAAAPGKGGWKYDAASKSAWYAYKEGGTWQQVWVETPDTFTLRTTYLDVRDVQLGLWALGYADKMSKVWQAIGAYQDAAVVTTPGPDAGGTDAGPPDAGPPDAGGPDSGGGTEHSDPNGDAADDVPNLSEAGPSRPEDSAQLSDSAVDAGQAVMGFAAAAPSSGCGSGPRGQPSQPWSLLLLLGVAAMLRRRSMA